MLTFEPVTNEFVLKIINSASAKSCELYPIPTTLLYENLDILLPTITNIINTSLTTGIVPRDLKTAVVKPLLKKPSLDKNLLKNYRPISNLPFLSRILEKVVLHKLLSNLQEKRLSNPFQSAYRAGHSTETVLLRIVNDILSALDNDNISVLLFGWIFLPLLTLLTTKFSSHACTLFLAFSLLHSNGFSHTSQTDISPLQSITRLRHHHSSCTVCLRAQYWGPSLRPVRYASLRYHS